MTSPILFTGQEDISFQGIGSNISTVSTAPITINTTSSSGQFRAGYARYSINVQQNTINGNFWIRNANPFSASSFWTSGRLFAAPGSVNNGSGWSTMRWLDSNGVVRLLIKTTTIFGSVLQIYKQDASSTQTQLGSNTNSGVSISPSPPDKIDVFINYSVAGTFALYVNGFQIFSYSGDVTTNGMTSLSYADWGMACGSTVSGIQYSNHWSECIVATQDTRNMSLVTQAPLANGNTASWTTSSTSSTISSAGAIANTNNSANTVYYVRFVTTGIQNGSLSSVQVSLNASLTGTLNMAIYSDLNGAPNTRLGQGNAATNPGGGAVVFPIAGVTLLGGTTYWVAMLASATWNYVQSGSQGTGTLYTQAIASFPATASGTSGNSQIVCQINFTQPNVSLSTATQSGPDYSATATQVQQYQSANTMPTGTFAVISMVQHGQCTLAPGGVQHIEFGVRTGGNDFFSPDLSPIIPWSLLTYNWDTNPNTTLAWATTDFPAQSTSFNMGYKATT